MSAKLDKLDPFLSKEIMNSKFTLRRCCACINLLRQWHRPAVDIHKWMLVAEITQAVLLNHLEAPSKNFTGYLCPQVWRQRNNGVSAMRSEWSDRTSWKLTLPLRIQLLEQIKSIYDGQREMTLSLSLSKAQIRWYKQWDAFIFEQTPAN